MCLFLKHHTCLSLCVKSTIMLMFQKFATCPRSACRTNKSNHFCWPRMVLLHCCLLWLLLPLSSRTQKLPTRDEELFQMQIRDKAFFHDSSVIPDGAEISSYLFRDTPKRYSHHSFVLFCFSASISLQKMPPTKKIEGGCLAQ